MLLAEGRLPECWIPPGHILEARALLELYNDLRRERTAWAQQIHAVLFLCRSWGCCGRLRMVLGGLGQLFRFGCPSGGSRGVR